MNTDTRATCPTNNGKDLEAWEDRLTLKKALLDLGRADYEKIRSELIGRLGYDKFRDLQNSIFKEIGTIEHEKSVSGFPR